MIISPAKKMVVDTDSLPPEALPQLIDRAERLVGWMRGLTYSRQKTLWACSDAIARQNAERLERMDLRSNLTPALLAYDGIQYAYMAPSVFSEDEFAYVQDRLRILSGLYGVLRPMDGVVPYRLEMQAKATVDGYANLYEFWGSELYQTVIDDSRIIVNLASREYSKAIERYLHPDDTYITCVFGEMEGEKVVQKGVYAKMARGEMVRYLASIHAETPDDIKGFGLSGYSFDAARSTEDTYVFIKG